MTQTAIIWLRFWGMILTWPYSYLILLWVTLCLRLVHSSLVCRICWYFSLLQYHTPTKTHVCETQQWVKFLRIILKIQSNVSSPFLIIKRCYLKQDVAHICTGAVSCFWWGPLYSSGGCCGAWCVFGWKQWMHHVEWIFASLRAWWTIITQTRFCSGRISITTLACPRCIWLCHPAVGCPLVSLQNTDDWLIICCMLVECSLSFEDIYMRAKNLNWNGMNSFVEEVIQSSRGVGKDYRASAQERTVPPHTLPLLMELSLTQGFPILHLFVSTHHNISIACHVVIPSYSH